MRKLATIVALTLANTIVFGTAQTVWAAAGF